eukprot:TRINITY_DN5505_c0_g1_i2.p1 TRINITY_DN5505_c0_g1~~TRINITY_DN5505_c0_g1_i2.p1  ORF type:complete len:134 (+),score=11.99 TRINITY_DN5505_c0_g1_i2:142-543(+)
MVLTRSKKGESSRIIRTAMETFGVGAELTHIPGGGSLKHPLYNPETKSSDFLFHMQGRKVVELAAEYGIDFFEHVRPGLSQSLGSIDWVCPHQTSKHGFATMAKFLGWDLDRIVKTLPFQGNVISCSIPSCCK